MEKRNTFKIAFVGGGVNSAAGYAHYTALNMDGAWKLVAGSFSRNCITNKVSAGIYGVPDSRCYDTIDELIDHESSNIDALLVLAPTPEHYCMVKKCLEKNIPVICEKSLAMTSNEANNIQSICKTSKGFLAVIYNYSGYPMIRELREIVQSQLLGEILHFQAEMPQEGFLRVDANGQKPVVQTWRQEDTLVPTIYLDLAVHLHELIYYVTGLKPIEVIADQSSYGWFPVIDNVTCLARYSNDVKGQFWFSKCSLGHRNGLRLRIFGTKGSAEWYQQNPEDLIVSFADGRRQVLDRASNTKIASIARYNRFKAGHPAGFNEALANLYQDMHLSLTKFKAHEDWTSPEVFGVDLAVEGLNFFESMIRSCANKKWELVH